MIFLKRLFKPKKVSWKYTDFIIAVDDVTFQAKPYFDNTKDYYCIRDSKGICVYVEKDKLESFKSIKTIYNEQNKLVNLSNILEYEVDHVVLPDIFYKTTPMNVLIKYVYLCEIEDITVYITIKTNLSEKDKLFKDLINMQIVKDKYHF